MVFELKKELIKEKLMVGVEQNVSKIELVEYALDELASMDDKDFNNLICKYRERKNEILKKQEEVGKELVELVDKYYDALVKGL